MSENTCKLLVQEGLISSLDSSFSRFKRIECGAFPCNMKASHVVAFLTELPESSARTSLDVHVTICPERAGLSESAG